MNNEEMRIQTLDLLNTLTETLEEYYNSVQNADQQSAKSLEQLLDDALGALMNTGLILEKEDPRIVLPKAIVSIKDSLYRVTKYRFKGDIERALHKIEFELIPLAQEAFTQFYVWGYIVNIEGGLDQYNQNDRNILYRNPYLEEAQKTGHYKYDVAFMILAYNKLEYTKLCVENLLKNIPKDLKYELILVNHGSTDGTKEYFESIHPTKQLDITVNGGGVDAYARIVESEFFLYISNDVLILPGAIENMLHCMKSDSNIAYVVPSTSNISNLQTLPEAVYGNLEEMYAFAKKNNISDPYRWEQRTRLCNPLSLYRTSVFFGSESNVVGYIHSADIQSFPDDRQSLLLRRAKMKMMLTKDAYCHHFGNVTLKDEITQKNEDLFYLQGRQDFMKVFGIDPWGLGVCYSLAFLTKQVKDEQGHVDILGINCGMGSNSLKIKEQLKEYCHNTDVTLYNITDQGEYVKDLEGISDCVWYCENMQEFTSSIKGQEFQYIVWDGPVLKERFEEVVEKVIQHMKKGGRLFIHQTEQNQHWLKKYQVEDIGDSWYIYER